jgi:flagellar biosynthesis/type III secretory pathway protein FliH
MRYLPGKTAKIIDFVANYTRVGLPDDEREWSLGEPLKRKKQLNENGDFTIRTCQNCFKVFKTAPTCPFCGTAYSLTEREITAHESIELQRISEEEAKKIEEKKKELRREQGRAQTFEQLVQLGKDRGYKNPVYYARMVMQGRRRR